MKKLLVLLLLLMLPASALANDYIVDARKDILTSYPEDCEVTILDHGTKTDYSQPNPPLFWSYDYVVEDASFVLLDEFFYDSRAKGATGLASQTFHETIAVSLSGADEKHLNGLRAVDAAHLNMTLTVNIPADYMLFGPDEGTPYNSRVYYVRVYGERGTLNATADRWLLGEAVEFTAEYSRPLVWVLYAVDRYVEPLQ